jgi:hypothetical protein
MNEKHFLCKMLRSGIPGPPFNVILVVSQSLGIVLHAPFTSEVAEVIPFGRIRAYGAREENFIIKWLDEGTELEDSHHVHDEVDDTSTFEDDDNPGVHFVTFFTAEAPAILEAIEAVIEGLLSSKMGVDNIDHIIEEVVREKEKSGRPFTKEEILESIDDLVMKKKLDSSSMSSEPSSSAILEEKPTFDQPAVPSSDGPSSPSNSKQKSSKKKKGKRKSKKYSDKGKDEEEANS